MNVTSIQTPRHRSRRNVPKVHLSESIGGQPRPRCRPGYSRSIAPVTWVTTEAEVTCLTCLGGLHTWREQYTGSAARR
jgi:hypothetical protein